MVTSDGAERMSTPGQGGPAGSESPAGGEQGGPKSPETRPEGKVRPVIIEFEVPTDAEAASRPEAAPPAGRPEGRPPARFPRSSRERRGDGRPRRDRGRGDSDVAAQQTYITEDTNVVYLTSSLESMLKVPNYVALFDSNVYFSVRGYLKDRVFDAVDRGLIYQAELATQQMRRITEKYPNLMLIEPVIGELLSMMDGDAAEFRRKREEFDRRAPADKDRSLEIHNRLCSLADLVSEFRKVVEARRQNATAGNAEALENILRLVRFVDEKLGVKRFDVRTAGDAGDQIAGLALYHFLIEGRNVAVYTRDEDVKKLVSTTYRMIRSMGRDVPASILRRIEANNLVVLKYNYDKGVYSRYFESLTIRRPDEFIFPSKIREREIPEILAGCRARVRRLAEFLPGTPEEKAGDDSSLRGALEHLVARFREDPGGDRPAGDRIKDGECLQAVAEGLGYKGIRESLGETLRELRRRRIEERVETLEQVGRELEAEVSRLFSGPGRPVGVQLSQELGDFSARISTNVLERLYYSTALERGRFDAGPADFERVRAAIGELRHRGHLLGDEEAELTVDEVGEVCRIPPEKVLRLASSGGLKCEGRRVFLNLKGIVGLMQDGS